MNGFALFQKERFKFVGIKKKPKTKQKVSHKLFGQKVETNVEVYSGVVDSSLFKS